MWWFDPFYLVILAPALLLAFYAQMKVKSAYARWTRQPNMRGLTGAQAAQQLIPGLGLYGVGIEGTPGELTDHYDPRSKTLRLSQGVANTASVASLAIVSHELGHALQDAKGYAPLKLRTAIVPAVRLSPMVSFVLFIIGFLLGSQPLLWLGVIVFSATVIFSLVTLPVEFDASRRGLQMLQAYNLVDGRDLKGAKAVLNAAALTYVAAAAQAVLTLLYYLMRLGLLGGRDD